MSGCYEYQVGDDPVLRARTLVRGLQSSTYAPDWVNDALQSEHASCVILCKQLPDGSMTFAKWTKVEEKDI